MNIDQAWASVLSQLQSDMPKASFETWLGEARPLTYENGALTIGVPNAYARDWLESRLASTISRLLVGIMSSNVAVNFVVVQAEELESPQRDTDEGDSRFVPSPRIHHSLNPRYTFENFVVGSGNRLAHAACQAVADKPAKVYNPLFLYGGVGLGRTHLLHAIGNACFLRGLNVGGQQIDALVVGGIGGGALMRLNAMGIKVYAAEAQTIRENLQLLSRDRLPELSMNNACQAHEGGCGSHGPEMKGEKFPVIK